MRASATTLALRVCVAVAAVAVSACCVPASALGASVPDFYGVWGNGTLGRPSADRAAALDLQASLGVRHVRQFFEWGSIEWRAGEYDFTDTDAFVADTSRRGLRVLPVLIGSTDWNTTKPPPPAGHVGVYPPRDPEGFAAFARATAARYGEGGSFWRENPDLPYVPIVSWQIWNEPSIAFFWITGPDPSAYVRLLAAASREIRSVEPNAEIVAAGIPNSTLGSPMIQFIRGMYHAGAAEWTDAIAVHPYGPDVTNVLAALRSVRHEMDAQGDPSPIWASEYGWATGGPPTSLTVDEADQATLVEGSLRLMGRYRTDLNLRGVTYYAWRDVTVPGRDFWTEHTGLLRVDGSLKPAAAAYARVAASVPLTIPPTTRQQIEQPNPEGAPSGGPATGSRMPAGILRVAFARKARVRARAGGRVRLTVGCWSPRGGRCSGTIELALQDVRVPRGAMPLAKRHLVLRSGARTVVTVRLKGAARRLLARQRRLRVRAGLRVRDQAGASATASRRLWLTAP
jgi:polysaccharide biosynthesis protein PslG